MTFEEWMSQVDRGEFPHRNVYYESFVRLTWDAAQAAQRERDAVIAEGWLRVHGWEPTQDVGRMIAAAIRARGDDG